MVNKPQIVWQNAYRNMTVFCWSPCYKLCLLEDKVSANDYVAICGNTVQENDFALSETSFKLLFDPAGAAPYIHGTGMC